MTVSILGWLTANALNAWLLFVVANRIAPAKLLKRAGLVIAASPLVMVAIILALYGLGAHPSDAFGTRLLQLFFTIVVLAMLSIGNLVFGGMIAAQIGFHRRFNAANLHRFPIRFLIRHGDGMKRVASLIWCGGGALMLYGIWFDMHL